MKPKHIEAILNAGELNSLEKLGDWFVLHLMSSNLDLLTVNELIRRVGVEINFKMVATAFFEYSKLAIGQQPFNLFNYIENRTPKDGLPSGCLSLCLRQVEFFRTLSKRPLTSPCLAFNW